jgi:hypothetical protein
MMTKLLKTAQPKIQLANTFLNRKKPTTLHSRDQYKEAPEFPPTIATEADYLIDNSRLRLSARRNLQILRCCAPQYDEIIQLQKVVVEQCATYMNVIKTNSLQIHKCKFPAVGYQLKI